MAKRGVCVVIVILGLAGASFAQRDPGLSLINSAPEFPSLELSNTQYFFLATGLNWMEPVAVDFLPALPQPNQPRRMARADLSKDSSKDVVDLERTKLFDYVHGEIGFLYGRSTGKFDRELEQGWVMGTAGTDKFSITAGAVFQNWSGSFRRH